MVVLVQEIPISLLPILDSMNNNNSINNTNSNITPKVITISNINKKLETLFYFSIPVCKHTVPRTVPRKGIVAG